MRMATENEGKWTDVFPNQSTLQHKVHSSPDAVNIGRGRMVASTSSARLLHPPPLNLGVRQIITPCQTSPRGWNMPEKHSRPVPGGRAVWYTQRLWELARDLPVASVAISAVAEFDQDAWFGPNTPPTCRAVALHAKRIYDADLNVPIILSADGRLMDGGHRIAKAWLNGVTDVLAVRFPEDPAPDFIVPQE
jgi:hypothetical protein